MPTLHPRPRYCASVPVAFIGLGSNLGDRAGNIHAALGRLDARDDVAVERVSQLYETQPIDSPPDALLYLNAAAAVTTTLDPHALLDVLLTIEAALGRNRPVGVVNAPRTIDLDLLSYAQEVIRTPSLTLPHPRLTRRQFVLVPLVEVASDAVHPTTGTSYAQLLRELRAGAPDPDRRE